MKLVTHDDGKVGRVDGDTCAFADVTLPAGGHPELAPIGAGT